jgi:predicted AlkP superfamily phosphohydrolase/phosphomutase
MEAPDGGRVLANTNFRRTAALWNMAGGLGKKVGFVGWWVTWPAEKVNGFIVSDHVAYSRFKAWVPVREKPFFHETYPPGLARRIEPLVCRPNDIRREEILALGDFTEEEIRRLYEAETPEMFHYPSILKFAFQTEKTYLRIGLRLLEQERPDLMGVYLEGIDPIGHCFWHFFEPDKFQGVSPEDARRLGKVIPNYYQYIDGVVGKFVQKAGPDTTLVIVSDHGMKASGTVAVPGRAASGAHSPYGIILAAGPIVKKGVHIQNATILDVAPTILGLLGLPTALDLEGDVLTSIMKEDFLKKYPIRVIESYDKWLKRISKKVSSPAEEKYRAMLRAMGYIK